ncbi:hypothetical protein [Microcystis phage Mwe-JY26]
MLIDEKDIIKSYTKALGKFGSQRKACEDIGVPRTTMQDILKRHKLDAAGNKAPVQPTFGVSLPHRPKSVNTRKGEVRRFIFSAAQDDTAVHTEFLRNLEAYASYLGAELMIGGFTYDKSLYEDHDVNKAWYHPSVQRYLVKSSIVINDSLAFCGEMNTLPTAVNPLAGFEVYTRHRSGIFPHAKVQLQSIPTMKGFPPKMNMTTGAVTMPNYVKKRAGIIAGFHHVIGAVLVEVDGEGDWFARHLIADEDGDFQDLNTIVEDGQVSTGWRVEAINWGDIHYPYFDPNVAAFGWGAASDGASVPDEASVMLDVLEPTYQFLHDVSDFRARNHHELRDPHVQFERWFHREEDIRKCFRDMSHFLETFRRPFSEVVVVESNHDLAFDRWLREADWKTDPVNAELYLEANLRKLQAIKEEDAEFSVLQWAMLREDAGDISDVQFLKEDQSFVICAKADDTGIECGMHGHLGANGSRGTPRQFTRMGPKANTGHTHSPSIIDGIYTAGTSSLLHMGYNKGLSSWSHSHVVTYPNGKRTIVTMKNGKWRAE